MCYHLNLTQTNANTAKNEFSQQIQALEQCFQIIDYAIQQGMPKNNIAFGGGTALAMYYLGHRSSYDVDLFLNDIQYLNYFSPRLWSIDYEYFSDSDYTEQREHIGLKSVNGIKVDIVACQNANEPLLDNTKTIFSRELCICSIEDIIANKIVHRKLSNTTRDIFDIAVTLEKYPNLVQNLLNKKIIKADDLLDLWNALNKLNYNQYNNEIAFVKPKHKFKNLALEAPSILLKNIESILNGELSNSDDTPHPPSQGQGTKHKR